MNSNRYTIQNLGQPVYLIRGNLFFEIMITDLSKNKTATRQGVLDSNGNEDRFQVDTNRIDHKSGSEAVRYVEHEVETKLQQGYQEKKGQQQFDFSNLNLKKSDDRSRFLSPQQDSTSTRSNPIIEEEETHPVESEHDGFEEEILQNYQFDEKSSQKKTNSEESEYGRSLISEALGDLGQHDVGILSKKITKLKRTGASHPQRPVKSQENSDKFQPNKRNATIFLRPAPLDNLQKLGDLNKYYITAKREGMSCYWDGTTLYTSSFKKCNPYQEFIQDFAKQKLIGQLVARNGSTICQQLRSLAPTPSNKWLDLVFIVEDLHDETLPFKERLRIIKEIKESQYIRVNPYHVFEEQRDLDEFIQSARLKRTEKIYLRHPEGFYKGGSSGGFYFYAVN